MSMGESDAKFPGQQGFAQPPSPSRENPGQVYPKSDPSPAPSNTVPGTGGATNHSPERYLGNPYLERRLFEKLDDALNEVINTIAGEQSEMGGSPEEVALIKKFKGWRNELEVIRSGGQGSTTSKLLPQADANSAESGGMFTD